MSADATFDWSHTPIILQWMSCWNGHLVLESVVVVMHSSTCIGSSSEDMQVFIMHTYFGEYAHVFLGGTNRGAQVIGREAQTHDTTTINYIDIVSVQYA